MKAPQIMIPDMVNTILRTLERAGFVAYVVGGAVRDMAMEKPPTDWDFTTSASRQEVEALFPDLTKFSLQHGTVTLVHKGRHYEVSTFRGALPTLEDDLARRDFTINAMAYHPEGERIMDPFGGRKDIAGRLVRAVGAPEDRFREDPLRMLRAVRISCELDFTIHPETRDAVCVMAPMLSAVAGERIRDEMMRILLSEKPSRGLRDLAWTGLLKEITPELMEDGGERKGISRRPFEILDRVPPNPVLRLAALFHDAGESQKGQELQEVGIAEGVMRRLRYSERMIARAAHLVRHHRDDKDYASSWNDAAVRRFVRGVGRESLESFFCLRRADLEAQGKDTGPLSELEKRVRAQVRAGFPLRVRDLKVDGRKVMEVLGLPEGPEVGRILEALLEKVLDHPEWNTKTKLIELLQKMSRD